MYILESKIEDIIKDFPVVNEWMDNISKNFLQKDIDLPSVKSFYTFILVKTPSDRVEEMLYDERFQFELSKVRINLIVQIGKNFSLNNRLPMTAIPEIIQKSMSEIAKVKIITETSFNGKMDVRTSIPNIEEYASIIEQIDGGTGFDSELNMAKMANIAKFDTDEILDKISKFGVESLTQEELKFLENQ